MKTIHVPEVGDTITWSRWTETLTEVTDEFVKSKSLYFTRNPSVMGTWDSALTWYQGAWLDRATLLQRQQDKLMESISAVLFVGGSMDGKRMALPPETRSWFAHRLDTPVSGRWLAATDVSSLPEGPNIAEEIYERCEVKAPTLDGKWRTEILMVYRGPIRRPKVNETVTVRLCDATYHLRISSIQRGVVFAHTDAADPINQYPRIEVKEACLYWNLTVDAWSVPAGETLQFETRTISRNLRVSS